MYFVIRYCRLLEEGQFRDRKVDFPYMLFLGAVTMLVISMVMSTFTRIKFLGHPLAFMMVYVWARGPENLHMRMSLLGLFPFSAPYLPWVLLLFSLLLGNPIETDLMGILVGHFYFFFDRIFPQVADVRGWSLKRPLATPEFFRALCHLVGMGMLNDEPGDVRPHQD